MTFKTLFKTESIEIQQTERGSTSYAYENAGDAMHDLYQKIIELEEKLGRSEAKTHRKLVQFKDY